MCNFIELADIDNIYESLQKLSLEEEVVHRQVRVNRQKNKQHKFSLFRKLLIEKLKRRMAVEHQQQSIMEVLTAKNRRGDAQLKLESDQADNGVFEASLEIERLGLNNLYSLCTTVRVVRDYCSVEVRSTVLKRGRLLQVKSPATRLLLCRYLNRLNTILFDGSIVINPYNGAIVYRLSHHFAVDEFEALISDLRSGICLIEDSLFIAHSSFSYNLFKILYLMDEISEEAINSLIKEGQIARPICTASKQKAEFIQHAIEISLYEFDFMFDWRLGRDISQTLANRSCDISRKQLEDSQRISLKDKQKVDRLNQQLLSFNQAAVNPYTSYDKERDYLRPYKDRLVKLLTAVKVKCTNYNEKVGVLSAIHIFTQQSSKWRAKTGGGFSNIDIADCLFTFATQKDQAIMNAYLCKHLFRRMLARKTEKQPPQGKIDHERQILNQIRNQMSASVCRFYESEQPQYCQDLFMIYCQYSDYSSFKRTRKNVMSLLMRLYFLSQLVEGLRFLHTRSLYHLDIKPQNMLIGKGFILKITDFGEAYHPNICSKDYRPGYTPPYAAPESNQLPIPFTEKFDTYSFGVILYESLFDMLPVEVSRSKVEQILNSCQMHKFRDLMLGLPERSSDFGPKRLIDMLFTVSLRCMSKDPSQRPKLDWVQVILKESISYLQILY